MGRRLGGKTPHIFLAFQNPEILIFFYFFTVFNIAVIVKIIKFLHIMPKNLNIFACHTMSKALAPRLYAIVL